MRRAMIRDRDIDDESLLSSLISSTVRNKVPPDAPFFSLLGKVFRANFADYLATSDTSKQQIRSMAGTYSKASNMEKINITDYFGKWTIAAKFLFILPSLTLSTIKFTLCLTIDKLVPDDSLLSIPAKVLKGLINFALGVPEMILTALLVKPVDKMQEFFSHRSRTVNDSKSKKSRTTTADLPSGLGIGSDKLLDRATHSKTEANVLENKSETVPLRRGSSQNSAGKDSDNEDDSSRKSLRS